MRKGLFYFLVIIWVCYAGFSCQKELSGDAVPPTGTTVGTAVFTLVGAPANCSGVLVFGAFLEGQPLDSNNSISIKINVTRTGSYNISTAAVNNYRFSASGIISTTGTQTIQLKGTG